MSTVVAWCSVDSRSLSAVYFVSESRISYSNQVVWDYGQKVFRLSCGGIIAYVGDVLYPTQMISQLKTLIDDEILFKRGIPNSDKISIIKQYIEIAFSNIPVSITTIIIIALVESEKFSFYELKFVNKVLVFKEKSIEQSKPIVYGSGAEHFNQQFDSLKSTTDEQYSRFVFQAFCHTIQQGKDPLSGGSVQMVGLYRNGRAQVFGVIENNTRFIYGQKIISYNEALQKIEWRNHQFERVDVETMERKRSAQIQPLHPKFKN